MTLFLGVSSVYVNVQPSVDIVVFVYVKFGFDRTQSRGLGYTSGYLDSSVTFGDVHCQPSLLSKHLPGTYFIFIYFHKGNNSVSTRMFFSDTLHSSSDSYFSS